MSAQDRKLTAAEREEVELLLPWYRSGTLSPEEQAIVERGLEADPTLRDELEAIERERDADSEATLAIGDPSANALDRIMAQIEQEERIAAAPAPRQPRASFLDFLAILLPSPQMRFAAAAAAVALVAQAAVIATLLMAGGPVGGYQLAGGPQESVQAGGGPRMIVAFGTDATIGDINALLEGMDAAMVGGPAPGGIYTVALPAGAGEAEVARALEELAANPLVSFAARAE